MADVVLPSFDLDGFNAALIRWSTQLVPQQTVELQKSIGLLLLGKLVARTPVDTGRARGGWQTSIGLGGAGGEGALDKGPSGKAPQPPDGPTYDEGAAVIASIPEGLPFRVLTVENAVPYIQRLMDEGHSPQAAEGTFAAVLAETEEEILSGIGFGGDEEFGG